MFSPDLKSSTGFYFLSQIFPSDHLPLSEHPSERSCDKQELDFSAKLNDDQKKSWNVFRV